jgi:hypothetical protein
MISFREVQMVHTTTCHTIKSYLTEPDTKHPPKEALKNLQNNIYRGTYSITNHLEIRYQTGEIRSQETKRWSTDSSAIPQNARNNDSSYHHPSLTKVLPNWNPILKELPQKDNHFGRGPQVLWSLALSTRTK